jgi:hypothetical protein
MVAEHGMKAGAAGRPIRYETVRTCLTKRAETARERG